MRVVSIDPGVTSGLVTALITDTKLTLWLAQDKYTPATLYRKLKGDKPELVIVEEFELRPNKKEGIIFYSAYLIGAAMMYCEDHAIELRLQKPAYGEGGHFRGDGNLRKAGVYIPGAAHHHDMSAMRHFMQWFTYGPGYQYNKSPQVVLIT